MICRTILFALSADSAKMILLLSKKIL